MIRIRRLTSLIIGAIAAASILATAAWADDLPIGTGANDLPIFDAHVHYKDEAWDGVPVNLVIQMMDRNGVAMALVSSTPDDGTIKLFEYAPNRIVPEVSPYHGGIGKTNWTFSEDILDYIEARLDKFGHAGIGEFHVHIFDWENKDVLRRVAEVAAKRKIFLHIHADYQVIETFFRHQPKLTIIWAHAGMVDPPDVVMRTMDKYTTLFADLSYREHQIFDGKGGLDPEWRAVLMKHADRFMVGSDTWSNDQWAHYDELIEVNRRWLALLPRAQAEAIAYKNAERLFGRKISKDLIGRR